MSYITNSDSSFGRSFLYYGLLGMFFLLPLEAMTDSGRGFKWIFLWGIILAVVWILNLVFVERRTPRVDKAMLPFLLYVGWALLSLGWATAPMLSVRSALLSVWVFVMFMLVVDQVDSQAKLQRVVAALVVGGVVSITMGYVTGSFLSKGTRLLLVPWQRGTTAYGYPLALMMSALGAIVLCARGKLRIAAFFFYLLGLYPLIAVGLRGAMVAIAMGVAACAIFTGNMRCKIPLAVLMIALIPGSIMFFKESVELPEKLVEHLTMKEEGEWKEIVKFRSKSVTVPDDITELKYIPRFEGLEALKGTTALRLAIWGVALDTFKEAPVLGVGLGQFILESSQRPELRYRPLGAHSNYLETLAELGLTGFGLLFWGDMMIMLYLFRSRRQPTSQSDLTVNGILFAVFISALTAGIFSTLVRMKIAWLVRGLIISSVKGSRSCAF